jgi:hypothetical protein
MNTFETNIANRRRSILRPLGLLRISSDILFVLGLGLVFIGSPFSIWGVFVLIGACELFFAEKLLRVTEELTLESDHSDI